MKNMEKEKLIEALEELIDLVKERGKDKTPIFGIPEDELLDKDDEVVFIGVDELIDALKKTMTEFTDRCSKLYNWSDSDTWATRVTVDDEGIHIHMRLSEWKDFNQEFLTQLEKNE